MTKRRGKPAKPPKSEPKSNQPNSRQRRRSDSSQSALGQSDSNLEQPDSNLGQSDLDQSSFDNSSIDLDSPAGTLVDADFLSLYDLRTETGRLPTSPLRHLVLHQQPMYLHFLTLIRGGVHPVVAGSTIGIPPRLIRSWLEQGKKAASGIYFNFWNDVVLAISRVTAETEMEVRARNPAQWLAAGPSLEVFEPGELPVPGFQGVASQQPGVNVNVIADSDTLMAVTDALVQLKRYGISLDPAVVDSGPTGDDPVSPPTE